MADNDDVALMGDTSAAQRRSRLGRVLLIFIVATTAIGLIIGLAVALSVAPSLPRDPLARAVALMTSNPLIDSHNDLPWAYRALVADAVFSPLLDISKSTANYTQTDIPRLKQGHVGAQIWSVYVGCNYQDKDAVRATQEQIDVVYQMQQRYPSFFQVAYTAADIKSIFRNGKFASLMGMEGGHQIDNSLASLRQFYQAGVRYMTLTHNCNTLWSQSCCNPPNGPYGSTVGLTAFGRAVVREMNRIGMMVDISHTSVQTMNDALDTTEAPVIFSHSNAYALCPTSRNVPDSVLRRLPANGGIIMITFVPGYVNCVNPSAANVSQVADHIDYVKNLIGADYIGLGADFDGIVDTVQGLNDVSTYPTLIAELIRRGYSDGDVIKIIGANLLRVMEKVEQVAQSKADAIPGQEVITNVTDDACRTSYFPTLK